MATIQTFQPCDNSTFANFKAWAKAISDALATLGWIQQNDTGQVVWTATVLTLTQVTVGANAVYSYSSFTGPAPRVGMSMTITGFITGGNNVTATLTAVSGGASGTVTVALTTQSNETHAGSGTTTAQSTVPSSTYVYEIWAPADALQTGSTKYYFKMEYGFSSTMPRVRVSLASATNGAGTLTGNILTTQTAPFGGATVSTASLECNFSGDTGRFGMMLWRNLPGLDGQSFVGIERTLATDGTPNTDGVTMVVSTCNAGAAVNRQQSLSFTAGPANILTSAVVLTGLKSGDTTTDSFNNGVPMSPVFPDYGKFGNPMTVVASMRPGDFSEGGLVQTTLYGATRTYLCSKNGAGFTQFPGLTMRWD